MATPARKKKPTKTTHRRGKDTSASLKHARVYLGGGIGLLVLVIIVVSLTSPLFEKIAHHWDQTTTRLLTHAGFRIEEVHIAGHEKVDPKVILELLNITQGLPIFHFDPRTARQDLEELPWIHRALVHRALPNTVRITIEERLPIALWQHKGKFSLIDGHGHVIETLAADGYGHLPVFIGEGAPTEVPEILKLLEKYPEVRTQIDTFTRFGNRRWDLHYKSGIIVKLAPQDLDRSLERLHQFHQTNAIPLKDISVIDLRLPDQLILSLKPGVKARLLAEKKHV